ncbi:MAG TPA: Lpg1974 family pore-forming outer membrane protein [Gemmataceae bacterium]|nr:Lpg1974 family pore-forming outer membrane protein [Gemmataceae bacterium]
MTAAAAKRLWMALLAATFSAMVHPALAQQIPTAPDTVLPPPASDVPSPPSGAGVAPPAPVLGAPSAVPAPSPFAPQPASPFAPPVAQDSLTQLGDSILNGWGIYDWFTMPQEFFAEKEVDILEPHLKAALTDSVSFPGGSQTTVQPPTTQVGWTAAPRIEVGWVIQPNLGYFAVSWRGLADQAEQTATSLDGAPFALRTRLDVNQGTFDYGLVPYSFSPRWFVNGRIGVAWGDVFFDNQAINAVQTLYASNNFLGAGPHVRGDLWREFNLVPGLRVFAQPDLMVLVGQIHQRYQATDVPAHGSSVTGSFEQRKTQTVPVFTLRTGLSYTPASLSHWRFTVGYEFEDWWSVGQVPGQPSRGQLSTNGVFLSAFATF